jgi:MFS family permease
VDNSLLGRLGPVRAYRELRREYAPAVLVLAAGDLVANFGFSLVFPFLTIYLTSGLGASATQAGLVLSGYSVASILSNAAGGWLADRYGRKIVLVVSITLTAVIVFAMGQVHDLLAIGVLTMVLGLIDPAFVPAARAAVADVVPEQRRSRAYGLLGVASAVGWIAGPSVGAGLSGFGYPVLFGIAGVIIGTYTIILVVAFPETRPDPAGATRAMHRAEAASPGSDGVDDIAAIPPPPGAPVEPLHRRAPARSFEDAATERRARRAFLALLPIAVVIYATTFQWVVNLPIHASRDLGVTPGPWGLLFALNGLIIVLFQLRASTATERSLKPRVMAVGALLYAAAYVLVLPAGGAVPAIPALGAAVIVLTVGEMLVYPVMPSFVADLSPIAHRGRYQGLFGAACGLGSALGAPLGGLVLDIAPGPAVWIATAALLGLASAALWRLGGTVRGLPAVDAA